MTDKRRTAEEIAKDITQYWLDDEPMPDEFRSCVAKALEDYRNEGIEEAAKVAEKQPMVKRDNSDYYCACSTSISDKIMALKRGV